MNKAIEGHEPIVAPGGPPVFNAPNRRGGEHTEPAEEAILRMCHDLVTPAVTIRHLAEMVATEVDLSDETRRRLSLIATEANNISEICAFALDAVRESHPVRLDVVVQECVDSVRTWFGGKIDVEADEGIVISAQRVPMLRLVANLLNNACQAAGDEGSVRVGLERDDDSAFLDVTNTGAPLDPGLFQGSDGSGRPATLGLRIVGAILSEYGGQVRCEPGPLGSTSVEVKLPLARRGVLPPPRQIFSDSEP
jgi:signal transduction histidine kinase